MSARVRVYGVNAQGRNLCIQNHHSICNHCSAGPIGRNVRLWSSCGGLNFVSDSNFNLSRERLRLAGWTGERRRRAEARVALDRARGAARRGARASAAAYGGGGAGTVASSYLECVERLRTCVQSLDRDVTAGGRASLRVARAVRGAAEDCLAGSRGGAARRGRGRAGCLCRCRAEEGRRRARG